MDEQDTPLSLGDLLIVVFAIGYLTAWALTPAGVM